MTGVRVEQVVLIRELSAKVTSVIIVQNGHLRRLKPYQWGVLVVRIVNFETIVTVKLTNLIKKVTP